MRALISQKPQRLRDHDWRPLHRQRPQRNSSRPQNWNTNILIRNADGTYTERTKEGVEYTYKGYYAKWREEGVLPAAHSSGVPDQSPDAGRLLSIKDPNGNGLTFAYNDDGSIHKVTDAVGREYRFVYENGLLTQVRGPENMRVQYFYNGTGNLRRVVGTAGETREYFYDGQERISSFLNPLGKEVRFQHDSEGRVTRVELGDGRVFNRFSYNFTDTRRVTTAVDERGTEWTYEYDEKGRMLQERRAGSDPVRYEYNDPENPYDYTMRRDATGRVWRYEYDQRRNITKVIEPLGVEKRFEWEAEYNRLVSMFDGRGTWLWTYDPHGNLLLREDPAGRTTRYEGYNQWVTASDNKRGR
ncbi:MAG: hypothetical protein U5P10_00210 [Spirochaetia bacterium]|nr:hypothetical protein [Spirochaetia bacterium]